jgi:hypothetical protein
MGAAKQRSGELWVLMQTRRLGFGRNPLRRRVDRIEAALLWCALILALLLVPIGSAVGTSYRNASDATAARQRALLHEVQARTLEGTEFEAPTAPGEVLARVQVGYVDQHGVAREGTTSVVIGTKAGVDVPVWLDQTGQITTAPRTSGDSAALGSTIGVLTITGSWLLLWIAFLLARIPLDRRRARAWDTEWRSVATRWTRGQK